MFSKQLNGKCQVKTLTIIVLLMAGANSFASEVLCNGIQLPDVWPPNQQTIVFNLHPGLINKSAFEHMQQLKKSSTSERYDIGLAAIFSYLNMSREQCKAKIETFLSLSEQYDIPIVVQLDGEQWWQGRPDLWNWWNPAGAGYNPENRKNVEWTGWGPEHAIKIAWRNWGRQIRVLPPPNFMSPDYRKACHDEMRIMVPLVMDWYKKLPPEKKHLFIGIKLGWESAIGTNSFYYPNGNDLKGKPASNDPKTGLKANEVPGRGVKAIGYASVKTADIAHSGELLESDLAEVVARHLNDLCYLASRMKVPRDKLFTHVAGWKKEELLYDAALNKYSCPGFSFYSYAKDPADDKGAGRVIKKSDAPHWAAVEWLSGGDKQAWKNAIDRTLADPKCRYMCIFNYRPVKDNKAAMEAIQEKIGVKKR